MSTSSTQFEGVPLESSLDDPRGTFPQLNLSNNIAATPLVTNVAGWNASTAVSAASTQHAEDSVESMFMIADAPSTPHAENAETLLPLTGFFGEAWNMDVDGFNQYTEMTTGEDLYQDIPLALHNNPNLEAAAQLMNHDLADEGIFQGANQEPENFDDNPSNGAAVDPPNLEDEGTIFQGANQEPEDFGDDPPNGAAVDPLNELEPEKRRAKQNFRFKYFGSG
jgi:hypothetical protein